MRLAVGPAFSRPSLRLRILAVALIPSLSLMLVGLGSAAYTGYHGYQATSESGKYAALNGNGSNSEQSVATNELLQALRDERQLTGEVLGDPTASPAALQPRWAKTDSAAAKAARANAQPAIPSNQLAALTALRPSVANRSISLVDAVESYSSLIVQVGNRASTNLAEAVADPRVVREDEINKEIGDLIEALEVGDALSYSAFSRAGMSSDAFRQYAQATGDFVTLLRSLQTSLPAAEAGQLNLLTTGPDGEVVGVVQRSILNGSRLRDTGTETAAAARQDAATSDAGVRTEDARLVATLPVPRADWLSSKTRLSAGLVALQNRHLAYAAGIARQVGRQQLITALIGSLALLVFALVVLAVSLTVSRTLIGRLRRLRRETIELSHNRLPDLVERFRQGRQVDVDAELAALDFGSDEIGQVADAFSEAQRTAVAAAAREAETRAGLRTVFLDIAHRSQAIIYRQLKVLDQAERTQEDPDQLTMLFQLDHLSTRARRNAENLIILGGGQAGRQWRQPVSLRQLVRSAISESEDYTRVKVSAVPDVAVTGSAVADLIHLLAELVDNATAFSPPTSKVEVRGNLAGRGLVIEIEDQGLGIEPEEIERFNQSLREPPDFQVMALAEEPRLGLFVVGRLAARHGIRVTLTPSAAYGGTKVVVLVPSAVLLAEPGLRALPELGPRLREEGPDESSSPAPAAPRAAISAPLAPPPRLERDPMVERAERVINLLTDPSLPSPVPPSQSSNGERPELPRRSRQSHLSPKLRREANAPDPAPRAVEPIDPETARSRMSALQRGTIRGRADDPEQQL